MGHMPLQAAYLPVHGSVVFCGYREFLWSHNRNWKGDSVQSYGDVAGAELKKQNSEDSSDSYFHIHIPVYYNGNSACELLLSNIYSI